MEITADFNEETKFSLSNEALIKNDFQNVFSLLYINIILKNNFEKQK